jgi:hypothetical protein
MRDFYVPFVCRTDARKGKAFHGGENTGTKHAGLIVQQHGSPASGLRRQRPLGPCARSPGIAIGLRTTKAIVIGTKTTTTVKVSEGAGLTLVEVHHRGAPESPWQLRRPLLLQSSIGKLGCVYAVPKPTIEAEWGRKPD